MIPLSAYVALSFILFMTGLLGVLIRRNFIIVLMSVEIMLNAANINLVAFSHYLSSMAGQLAALFVIAAGGESGPRSLAMIYSWPVSVEKLRERNQINLSSVNVSDILGYSHIGLSSLCAALVKWPARDVYRRTWPAVCGRVHWALFLCAVVGSRRAFRSTPVKSMPIRGFFGGDRTSISVSDRPADPP